MVREGRVFISVATDPDFGSSYYVTAYEVGAQVTSGSSGTTATVRAGHGFAANDKFIVGTDATKYNTVTAVTSTTLTITAMSLSAGDLLVNLGQDTGISTPNYVQSVPGLTVYADMDYSNVATNNTVQTDSNGKYRYYHKGIDTWELVRSSLTVPIALYTDAAHVSVNVDGSRLVNTYATAGAGTLASPWTGWETAFSSIPTSGDNLVFTDGYYTNNTSITLPVNLTGWLRIKGNGGAIIKITATTPGLFGIAAHSDYDTLKYVHIEGIQIDGNSIAGNASNASPILFGPYTTVAKRLNYANIIIRDIVMTGVSETGHTQGISMATTHSASGETATSCVDVLIENVRQVGGNSGIVMTAGCDDASVAITHTFERVTIRDCYHKSANVPSALVAAAGLQMGQSAIVKDLLVEGCFWQNSGDVGVEIDNPYRCVVRDCTSIDAYASGFYATNFNTLVILSKNNILFDGCRAIVQSGAKTDVNTFNGFKAQGATAALAMGSSCFRDCYYENLDTYVHRAVDHAAFSKRIVIDGLQVYAPNLVDAASTYYSLMNWINQYNGSTNVVKNVRMDWAMNAGGVTPIVVCFQFDLEKGRLEFDNVVINATFTNAAGAPKFAAFDSTQNVTYSQNISGFVRGLTVEAVTGALAGSDCYGVRFRQYLSATANILVEHCDFSGMPANTNYFTVDVAADRAQVSFRNNVTSIVGYRPGFAAATPRNVGTWPINAATDGTDTFCTNGTAYVGSVFVPESMTVTGVQYLVGSVGGTDKVVASLHDSVGTLLANSSTAGATVGTAAQLQQVALTATFVLVPGWYFLALTFNGATAKFRTIPAYCNSGSGVLGNGVTQTFGTPAAFTGPTTFTADKVPVASLY